METYGQIPSVTQISCKGRKELNRILSIATEETTILNRVMGIASKEKIFMNLVENKMEEKLRSLENALSEIEKDEVSKDFAKYARPIVRHFHTKDYTEAQESFRIFLNTLWSDVWFVNYAESYKTVTDFTRLVRQFEIDFVD
jgi:hypothetical protein